jgi:hypothetical protein
MPTQEGIASKDGREKCLNGGACFEAPLRGTPQHEEALGTGRPQVVAKSSGHATYVL